MVIGWVCNGTSKIHDDRSWRIPLGLFFIIPTIIASLIWFIPEVRTSEFPSFLFLPKLSVSSPLGGFSSKAAWKRRESTYRNYEKERSLRMRLKMNSHQSKRGCKVNQSKVISRNYSQNLTESEQRLLLDSTFSNRLRVRHSHRNMALYM